MLVLKRTGIRNFPDGRHVALYENKQLGLVFSVPYAGKGQTPGEIIPGTQVIQATNEEVDAEDKGEYDYEGDMAISQLKSIISNSMKLKDMLEPDTNLPEWVQAKITLAEDYVVTAANYMEGQQDDLDEEVEIQEGTLAYHLNQAELHDKNENEKLRDYHMTMAQHRVRGMRTPVNPNKKQEKAYKNNLEQGKRFSSLRSQFTEKKVEKDKELNVEDPTLQDLHSKLNPKNQEALRNLAKTNPRKALEIADKLTAATDNSQEQDQKVNSNK